MVLLNLTISQIKFIGIQVTTSNNVGGGDVVMGGIDRFEPPKGIPQGGFGGVQNNDVMPQQPKLVKKSSVVDKVE